MTRETSVLYVIIFKIFLLLKHLSTLVIIIFFAWLTQYEDFSIWPYNYNIYIWFLVLNITNLGGWIWGLPFEDTQHV